MGTWLLRIAAGSLVLAGCVAHTVNLTAPDGPRFEGRYAAAAEQRDLGERRLRVVSFNIKLARQIDRAITVLESPELRAADVIALQEMDDAGVERIARALSLNYVYFPGAIHPTEGRYFGPAILTPWPIDSAWKVVLPHRGSQRGQRRTATAAIVRIEGRPVRVYAVHLENQTRVTRAEHRDQAAAVVADAAGAAEPVIVAGDFNSHEIGRYFARHGYEWPTANVGRTVALFSWDHIFAKGLAPAGPGGAVKQVLGASDHRPVWAALRLGPAASAISAPASPAGSSPPR